MFARQVFGAIPKRLKAMTLLLQISPFVAFMLSTIVQQMELVQMSSGTIRLNTIHQAVSD